MIISDALRTIRNVPTPEPGAPPIKPETRPEYIRSFGGYTRTGKSVSAETAKTIATAYRCGNILSDDIASLPFQVFRKSGRSINQVEPQAETRNTAFLMEIQPNRWMTPFVFKKTVVQWLIYYGNAYIWEPVGGYREWFILDADKTAPEFDKNGGLWFKTKFPNGKDEHIPSNEILHLMINSTDGLSGKSVLTYARETIGRQLGAHETQDQIYSQGLNPAAVLWVDGEVNKEAREKIKESYLSAIRGSENSGGVAVMDSRVSKFETVTMKPTDAQFLETVAATDSEIANFFGMPLHKLNMGKQSYESNTQQQLDYLSTTLNPYLVQWEQAGRLKWLKVEEQGNTYLRFIREALLWMDAKTRSDFLKGMILSGQMTPNEARQVNDLSAYEGGDSYYIPSNMARVMEDGRLDAAGKIELPAPSDSEVEVLEDYQKP